MSEQKQVALMIRGAIAELPEAQRAKVMEYYRQYTTLMGEDECAIMAVALIGAELAAKEEV